MRETVPMQLRERTGCDLSGLSVLLRRVHESDGYPTVWPSDVDRWLVRDSGYGAWVGELDGALVGHVGLARPSTPAGTELWTAAAQRPVERLAAVTRLFAAPETRGAGVGRRLLQHAAEAAHRLGLWPVLDVRHDGRPGASRLYAAAGWHLVGTAPRRLASELCSRSTAGSAPNHPRDSVAGSSARWPCPRQPAHLPLGPTTLGPLSGGGPSPGGR
jgi:GNAT superfamily N-acetyltransferase